MAEDLNYTGIKIHELDEKEYLIKLLVEHEEGSKYDSNRPEASIESMEAMDNSYYYSEDL